MKIFFKLLWNLLSSLAVAGLIFFVWFILSAVRITTNLEAGLYIGLLCGCIAFVINLIKIIQDNQEREDINE